MDHRHIIQSLRRDLAKALAGDQRLGFLFSRDRFGDAQHHSSIKHHAQRPCDRGHDLALDFTEGRAVVMVGNLFGYIDTTGQFVVEPQYARAAEFSEGLAAVLVGDPLAIDSAKWGFIDAFGTLVIEPGFDDQYNPPYFRDGLARVRVGEAQGYINPAGEFVWQPTQ